MDGFERERQIQACESRDVTLLLTEMTKVNVVQEHRGFDGDLTTFDVN